MIKETKSKKNIIQNSNGVGKKFLIISISLTILLNGSVALWFFGMQENMVLKNLLVN